MSPPKQTQPPRHDERPTEAVDPGRQFVAALARGLRILDSFRTGDESLSNRELAERTGLASPTVSRLTYTLTRLGWLRCSVRTGRYMLDVRAIALGSRAVEGTLVRRVAREMMQGARDELNLCCAIGYLDGTDVVYLEYLRSSAPLILGIQTGSRVPLVTTAMGRALIGQMPDPERAMLLSTEQAKDPARWPTTLRGIESSLAMLRALGFTQSLGEWEAGVHSVGVPLDLGDCFPPMALTLGGGADRVDTRRLTEVIGPYVVQLAARIRTAVRASQPD